VRSFDHDTARDTTLQELFSTRKRPHGRSFVTMLNVMQVGSGLAFRPHGNYYHRCSRRGPAQSRDIARLQPLCDALCDTKGKKSMPFVNVKITSGPEVTREKKAAVVAGISNVLVDILQKKPESIHIVIDEVDPDNWGFTGALVSELRKQHT
jgi:4-oxalocrotonate tautomerase